MNKKILVTTIFTVILIGVVAFAASAQTAQTQGLAGPGGPGIAQNNYRLGFASLQRILLPPSPRELERMGIALSLTAEQKAKIKELSKTFNQAVRAIVPNRAPAIKAVVQGLQTPNPNKTDLQTSASKVAEADQAILNAEFDFWIALKATLSSQQQTQLQGFMMQKVQREFSSGAEPGAHPDVQKPNSQKPKGQKPAGQAGAGAANKW